MAFTVLLNWRAVLILFAVVSALPAAAGAQVTVTAVRVESPLRIDGRLDEDLYRTDAPATAFTQTEPTAGALGAVAPGPSGGA